MTKTLSLRGSILLLLAAISLAARPLWGQEAKTLTNTEIQAYNKTPTYEPVKELRTFDTNIKVLTPICEPAAEVCDGKDNDCDQQVDEGCSCKVGEYRYCSQNVGVCKMGVERCVEGQWTVCSGVLPSAETCDGIDNDCDGTVDNGVKNACGACGPAPAEICDGKDNNCDGQTDEGLLNACGQCGAVPSEICDGKDNNCNGQIDEGLLNACKKCGPLPAETCGNNVDDDCNGQTDENCIACNNGVREDGEACDRSDLAGQSCQSLKYAGGTLACNEKCAFDTSGCYQAPRCRLECTDAVAGGNSAACQIKYINGTEFTCTEGPAKTQEETALVAFDAGRNSAYAYKTADGLSASTDDAVKYSEIPSGENTAVKRISYAEQTEIKVSEGSHTTGALSADTTVTCTVKGQGETTATCEDTVEVSECVFSCGQPDGKVDGEKSTKVGLDARCLLSAKPEGTACTYTIDGAGEPAAVPDDGYVAVPTDLSGKYEFAVECTGESVSGKVLCGSGIAVNPVCDETKVTVNGEPLESTTARYGDNIGVSFEAKGHTSCDVLINGKPFTYTDTPIEFRAEDQSGYMITAVCHGGDNTKAECPPAQVPLADPECGNGTREPGEECDGGPNMTCTGDCVNCRNARCGDNFVWEGEEECDLGTANSDTGECTTECRLPACGDAIVQKGKGEDCDLGPRETPAELEKWKAAGCNPDYCQWQPQCLSVDPAAATAYEGETVTYTFKTKHADGGKAFLEDKWKAPVSGDSAKVEVACEAGLHTTLMASVSVNRSAVLKSECDPVTIECKPRCGNGRLDQGEDCDQGERNGTEGADCDAACKKVPVQEPVVEGVPDYQTEIPFLAQVPTPKELTPVEVPSLPQPVIEKAPDSPRPPVVAEEAPPPAAALQPAPEETPKDVYDPCLESGPKESQAYQCCKAALASSSDSSTARKVVSDDLGPASSFDEDLYQCCMDKVIPARAEGDYSIEERQQCSCHHDPDNTACFGCYGRQAIENVVGCYGRREKYLGGVTVDYDKKPGKAVLTMTDGRTRTETTLDLCECAAPQPIVPAPACSEDFESPLSLACYNREQIDDLKKMGYEARVGEDGSLHMTALLSTEDCRSAGGTPVTESTPKPAEALAAKRLVEKTEEDPAEEPEELVPDEEAAGRPAIYRIEGLESAGKRATIPSCLIKRPMCPCDAPKEEDKPKTTPTDTPSSTPVKTKPEGEPEFRSAMCRWGDTEAVLLDTGSKIPLKAPCEPWSREAIMKSMKDNTLETYRQIDGYYKDPKTENLAKARNAIKTYLSDPSAEDDDASRSVSILQLPIGKEGSKAPPPEAEEGAVVDRRIDPATVRKYYAGGGVEWTENGKIKFKTREAFSLIAPEVAGLTAEDGAQIVSTTDLFKLMEASTMEAAEQRVILHNFDIAMVQGGGDAGCSLSPTRAPASKAPLWTLAGALLTLSAWRYRQRKLKASTTSSGTTRAKGLSTRN